ncbi:MAG TPA: hypothetical protein VK155_06850 [Bacteroidales bacterium]|jgi:hypothetical protein|nr:hypothetical protein [Bacteroidales bacterium]
MKKFLFQFAILLFLIPFSLVNAQENKSVQKENRQSGMGMPSDIQSCMHQIAADSTMRMEMVSRMMDNMKGDSAAMRQFCRKIMGNSEMHRAMMQMMQNMEMNDSGGMGGMMKHDVTDDIKHKNRDTVLYQQH